MLVIFLFLRSLKATIIPSVAVPLSLVGTFAVMYGLGYSLDNLSLMALTISTGFVVDDAIVMIENISRFLEEGDSPMDAALKGAEQIGFTILSLTVSLIAVLIPLVVHGRRSRPTLPRICGHAGGHHRDLGGRLADAHADDVGAHSEAHARIGAGSLLSLVGECFRPHDRVLRTHAESSIASTRRSLCWWPWSRSCSRSCSTSSFPKDSSRCRTRA